MYGLIQSNAGEPRSMGQKIVLNGLSQARKSGIDIVFRHFSRFENLTVAENVAPGLSAMKFLTAISARSAETARRYGRPLDPKREVWRLSVGSGGASRLSGRSLGYVASFPIPEVISGVNATMLGARSDNPNIKVKIIRARTWFDRGKEADAAKALVDQHADVLMQHTEVVFGCRAKPDRCRYSASARNLLIPISIERSAHQLISGSGWPCNSRRRCELRIVRARD